jgi:glycyl-tRNA synthetase beta chain
MATKKAAQSPKAETLLVELLTEELPPKSLRQLGQAFADEVLNGLVRHQLKLGDLSARRGFATPRRLAVLVPDVLAAGERRSNEVTGPSVTAPSEAVAGFAKKHGLAVSALEQRDTPKGRVFAARVTIEGASLDKVLVEIVKEAVKKLPIPKLMRWGSGDAQFVRPVHGLVMMHGKRLVPGDVLGVSSGKTTLGHRFLSSGRVAIDSADRYDTALDSKGRVIAEFVKRRGQLGGELERHAGSATMVCDDALFDEITALVEWPAVYEGTFDPDFLEVPPECLILSMQQHQKYVPLRDKKTGKLLPRFLFVSNTETKDPREIIHGNERVLRARLADAKFFYDQDRRQRLDARVPMLKSVIYHNKLGTQFDRVERIRMLAGHIARQLGANAELAERAGFLSKADLLTNMVGEFPELQGLMGGYYAKNDNEVDEVRQAIAGQYQLRLDDADPEDLTSVSLYLADRIDSLVGLFGIGEAPTGEKDPFGLRRAALGVISAFELISAARRISDKPAPDVRDFLAYAATLFPPGRLSNGVVDQVHDFILERYSNNLATVFRMDKKAVEAVLGQHPNLIEVKARVDAVQTFQRLPEAESLASANKRIRNILRKSDATQGELSETLLTDPAERALFDSMQKVEPQVRSSTQQRDFAGALRTLATMRGAVDKFFDDVLVNAEDARVRANRHALLRRLDTLMNQVADISKLAVEK